MSCACVDVDFGTYANAVALYPPVQLGITRVPVTVDRCIAEEVQDLWSRGIVTTGNCCGHNKAEGFISVRPEDSPMMVDLGYEPHRCTCHPEPEPDHFRPKSTRMMQSREELKLEVAKLRDEPFDFAAEILRVFTLPDIDLGIQAGSYAQAREQMLTHERRIGIATGRKVGR